MISIAQQESNSSYKLERWNTDDGLPQNSVNAILKASDGFLWVGTYGGLVKFDGLNFDRITVAGLKYERIICLYEDRARNIWVGSENNGLFCIKQDTTIHYRTKGNGVSDVLELSNGEIVVVVQTRGLARVEGYELHHIAEADFSGVRIDQAVVSHNDAIWLNTSEGVFQINTAKKERNRLLGSKHQKDGRTIGLDSQGSIYFANQTGFYLVDEASMTFRPFFKQKHGLLSRQSYLNEKQLWYGDVNNRLFLKLLGSEAKEIQVAQVSGGEVSAIYEAEEGLWIGLNGGGLLKLTKLPVRSIGANQGLKDEKILAIHQDAQQNLWIGTNSGNLYQQLPSGVIKSWKKGEEGPKPDVWSITSDGKGTIWTGSFGGGIYRYDSRRDKGFEKIPLHDSISTVILALWYDTLNQRLLIGTDRGGVYQWKDEKWSTIIAEHIHQARVAQIYQTPKDELYIATLGDGVKVVKDDIIKPLDTSNGLPFNTIRSIYKDDENVIWYGTYGGGLLIQQGDYFARLTQQQGLHDNLISAIQEDAEGNLWMSCNNGVFKANKKELLSVALGEQERIFCQVYNKSHGMGDSETNGGFQPSSVKLNDNTLLFPTMKGVAIFKTDRVDQSTAIEHLAITAINYGDTSIKAREEVVIPKEHRDFSIHFTAPHYSAPELIQFEYRLLGYNQQWQSSGTNRFVSYTSLAQGEYTFQLRARNSQGVLSKQTLRVQLTIEAYWYELLGVQVALVLLVLISIGLGIRRKLQLTQKRTKELEQQVTNRTKELKEKSDQLAKINQTKTTFYASVSHELKTPLTLIKGPLASIIERHRKQLDPSVLEDLELMNRNTDQLSELIVQLMDIARSENEDIELNESAFNINELVQLTIQNHQVWIQQKEIELIYAPFSTTCVGKADKGLLQKTLSNLLSNALKFTPQAGKIKIETSIIDAKLQLIITDSGGGISEKDLPFIFDRFYKSNTSTNTNKVGSGIGLSVVREFAALMGGEINAKNLVEGGACFTLTVPFPLVDNIDESIEPEVIQKNDDAEHIQLPKGNQEEWPLILLVDDNRDIRKFIIKNLSHQFRFIEAENGEKGYQKAKEVVPDLIISDIMMPQVDGIELLQLLKSTNTTDFIPVLLLTAKGSATTRIEGWKEGAAAYLEKPFNTHELSYRVKGILDNRKTLRTKILRESDSRIIVKETTTKSDFEQQFECLIEYKIPEPEFSFATALEDFAMSRSTFQRAVKEHYQCSPQQYLKNQRLKKAKQLLEQKEGNVSEVAYACGFNSVSYFNRAFKEQFQTTPSTIL